MYSRFDGYGPFRGHFPTRYSGSIVSDRFGQAVPYALFNLEPRGQLFVMPGETVYEGIVIGEHNRGQDIDVNPCKEKKLTNVRAAGKDEHVTLTPPRPLSLEQSISFIRPDELLEVTPLTLRMRKVELSRQKRLAQLGREKRPEK
jgi:GTP-binding protein